MKILVYFRRWNLLCLFICLFLYQFVFLNITLLHGSFFFYYYFFWILFKSANYQLNMISLSMLQSKKDTSRNSIFLGEQGKFSYFYLIVFSYLFSAKLIYNKKNCIQKAAFFLFFFSFVSLRVVIFKICRSLFWMDLEI